MGYKKILSVLFIVIALSFVFIFIRRRRFTQTLIVGTNAGFKPYEYYDASKKLTGFDVELGTLIGKKLSVHVEFKHMPFEDLIPALKNGSIDMIMAGMSITPERKKQMFMVPYGAQAMKTLPLVFWKKASDLDISKLEDVAKLGERPICALKGSIQEAMLNSVKEIAVRTTKDPEDFVDDIKQGKAIACLVEDSFLKESKKKYPELSAINIQVPKDYVNWGNGIGIAKNREDLFRKVLDAVSSLKKEKVAQKVYKKWFE